MFRNSAHIYDLIYEAQGKDYEAEARQIDEIVKERFPGASSLLDVACGTGGHLAHLQEAYEVVGLDIDPGMLDQARRRLPDVELVEGDMRTVRLGRQFDAVICLFSSIGYMRSPEELTEAARTMAEHLGPGGVLIVDGWVRPDNWFDPGIIHSETARTDSMIVVRSSRSERRGNKTLLEMHHLVTTLQRIDHFVDHHELTLFSANEYERAFTDAGLTVEVIPSPMAGRDRYIGMWR
jgi:SAM-dependent methyltransferase